MVAVLPERKRGLPPGQRPCAAEHNSGVAPSHLLKRVFDQERPDRETLAEHFRGIPLSGKKYDAFPSGHALHVGALASAATVLPASQRNAVWGVGAALVLTRIVLLAHWVSDVVAGLALGVLLERALRFVTGYGRASEYSEYK